MCNVLCIDWTMFLICIDVTYEINDYTRNHRSNETLSTNNISHKEMDIDIVITTKKNQHKTLYSGGHRKHNNLAVCIY